jgi:hypothetical protein
VELSKGFSNNLTRIYLGKHITLWFSYEMIVAYAVDGEGTFKSRNVWGSTTGKHLASIPAREVLEPEEFEARLAALLAKIEAAL